MHERHVGDTLAEATHSGTPAHIVRRSTAWLVACVVGRGLFGNIGPCAHLEHWLLGLLLVSPAAFALSGSTVATDNVKARLVSEVNSIAPGQVFWVALELDIRDGWHTYWRNPGDSGEPTKLNWQLPPGFTAGDIVWTTPHRFEIAPLVNYGYAKHAVHLVQITAPKDLKAGAPVSLAAKAELAGVLRCVHSRRCEFAVDGPDQRCRPAASTRPRPRCSPPRAASCPVRSRRRLRLEFRATSSSSRWGRCGAPRCLQITSLAVLSLR